MPTNDEPLESKSIRVRPRHNEWLAENEWFNLSGAVREMLDEEIDQ